MKRFKLSDFYPVQLEDFQYVLLQLYRRKIPRYLFLILCLNLVFAPLVQAATGNEVSRTQAYALGILGLATLAFSIYLFVVMFQPERF